MKWRARTPLHVQLPPAPWCPLTYRHLSKKLKVPASSSSINGLCMCAGSSSIQQAFREVKVLLCAGWTPCLWGWAVTGPLDIRVDGPMLVFPATLPQPSTGCSTGLPWSGKDQKGRATWRTMGNRGWAHMGTHVSRGARCRWMVTQMLVRCCPRSGEDMGMRQASEGEGFTETATGSRRGGRGMCSWVLPRWTASQINLACYTRDEWREPHVLRRSRRVRQAFTRCGLEYGLHQGSSPGLHA